MSLQDSIQEQMKIHDATQADIARRSGLSTAIVSQICSGKTKDPGIQKVMKIAKAIGCSLNDLARGIDD